MISRLSLVALCSLAHASCIPGFALCQEPGRGQPLSTFNGFDIRQTKAGGPVVAMFVEPFLKAETEQQLLEALLRPAPFTWDRTTTLQNVRDDLVTLFPVVIDHLRLDELGLSADDPLTPARRRDDALFGEPTVDEADADAQLKPSSWWNSDRPSGTPVGVTLGAKLSHILGAADLVLTLHSGQPVLTSIDGAGEMPATRYYDITPLDLKNASPTGMAGQFPLSRLHVVIQLITVHVEPDTWENLGGPSTMMVVQSGDRTLLIVSTTLFNHLKVESLLNQLNARRRP